MGKKPKKPHAAHAPPANEKRVRCAESPATAPEKRVRGPLFDPDTNKLRPTWMVQHTDLHHDEWGWGVATAGDLSDVLNRLRSMESMTWNEIARMPHTHPMAFDSVCREAQERLIELKLDEFELYQIGFGNVWRIFGIRYGAAFAIIWLDKKHTVYPVEKKRT